MRAGCQQARKQARNRLLNGFYRSPILSLLAPLAPGPLDLARVSGKS